MLLLLSKYLIQYKRVCIPHVGTFELVQLSPKLNVAEKLLTPPSFRTRYLDLEVIPQHQFDYLSPEVTKEQLMSFGEKLKSKIQQSGFHWNGFGKLSFSSNEIKFEAEQLTVEGLPPIPAEKVLRENVQHSVLVGDHEMTSQQVNDSLAPIESKRSVVMIVGWILLIVAVVAIVILIYTKNFRSTSTGMQTRFGL